jgi:hypothetical protein
MRRLLTILICLTAIAAAVVGQTAKRNPRPTDPKPSATPQAPQPTPTPVAKRNERPSANPDGNVQTQTVKQVIGKPAYVYEFTRPDFVVSYVLIEHDESGHGKISF